MAFVDFKHTQKTQEAFEEIQSNPIVMDGRTLDVSFARTPHWHPNDQTRQRSTEVPQTSQRLAVPPSPSLFIHYQGDWWEAPPNEVKYRVSQLPGFRTMRFRKLEAIAKWRQRLIIMECRASNTYDGLRRLLHHIRRHRCNANDQINGRVGTYTSLLRYTSDASSQATRFAPSRDP